MDLAHRVKWQVSLANGDTFFEGKGPFVEVKGELSPWQKLLEYQAQQKTHITSLSLYTDDGRTYNLPSSGKNPKFREFDNLKKPLDFEVCRKITREMAPDGTNKNLGWFTVAIADYGDHELQIWVDEQHTQNMWVLMVEKKI
ncbi:MAG: hypothetical protein WC871_02320 [Bacteroidales bacterium]|jgi:hypothetical protein